MKSRLVLLALIAVAPFAANAQFTTGGPAPAAAWSTFKLPNKSVKLDFRNANADMVLAYFTKISGITIIKDPALKDTLTLTTATAIPIKDAFEVLSAALSVRNFEMRKEGNILVVRAKQNRGGFSNMTPDQLSGLTGGGTANIELRVFKVTYAAASAVAKVINDVFQQQQQMNFPGFTFGGGGRPGMGGRGGFGGATGGSTPNVRASSDDYSNTVIVNAPRSMMDQVEDLIGQIDKQTDVPQRTKVYALKFAPADQVQTVIQGVLQANVPRGRGTSSGSTSTPIDQRFGFFGGLGAGRGQNNSAGGTALADLRTNSVIVTTTEENQKIVENLMKELDTEVKVETTTFVFPLQNARADQMSTLFRQAFGQRSGVNGGGTGTTRTNTGTTNTGRTNTNPAGTGAQRNLGGEVVNGSIPVDLEDPNADSGDLATSVGVNSALMAQVGGGGNRPTTGTTGGSTTGRTADGRLVQVNDLTNQITVIPDQNTNSLIVVTTPQNAEVIRRIIAQLDKIPEQVLIETIIVEASLDAESKFGVEWTYAQNPAFNNPGTTSSGGTDFGVKSSNPQGFKYTITGANFNAFLNAMQTDTRFNVLSTPRIFTSNNVQAEINISQRVPYVVSQRTDANGNITYNYDYQDVGIVLTVTPRITAGGYVTMDVTQTANDLQGFTSFNAPIVNQRQAQTTVAAKDGDTIILGGIIRSTISSTTKKIPILGDIPILGQFFRSTDKTNNKTELLVFLSPRVVRNPDEAAKMTEEEKSRLSKGTQDRVDGALPPKVDKKPETDTKKGGKH